jgi:hypothetical protein
MYECSRVATHLKKIYPIPDKAARFRKFARAYERQ